MDDHVTVRVIDGEETEALSVESGRNLRDVLMESGYAVYAPVARVANCGGRGLCATCGVRIVEGEAPPAHWHDRLADSYGYPRLSCQIEVETPLTVELLEKRYWGQLLPR